MGGLCGGRVGAGSREGRAAGREAHTYPRLHVLGDVDLRVADGVGRLGQRERNAKGALTALHAEEEVVELVPLKDTDLPEVCVALGRGQAQGMLAGESVPAGARRAATRAGGKPRGRGRQRGGAWREVLQGKLVPGRERPRDVLLQQLQASRDACRLPQSDDEAVGTRHFGIAPPATHRRASIPACAAMAGLDRQRRTQSKDQGRRLFMFVQYLQERPPRRPPQAVSTGVGCALSTPLQPRRTCTPVRHARMAAL